MRRFWKYQVRYRLARRLTHIGLWVMPDGLYKQNLLAKLWGLYDDVVETAALRLAQTNEEGNNG